MRRECIRIAAVVANVISAANGRRNSAEAFLFYRAQKVARILSPLQSGLRSRRRVKAALGSETRFFWCVIERAHDEVFAVVSLQAPRQFVVLVRKPLHHLRPRDIPIELRIARRDENKTGEREDQSPKTDSIGPPIKISMGSRFHSYS